MKKLLLGLGLSIISFIGFSNATLIENQLTKVSSSYNSGYKISFLNKGSVISEFLGTSKGILALDSNVLFWWGTNGKPYLFSPIGQGFFNKFYSCSEFTGSVTTPTNCTQMSLNSDSLDILQGFFSKVKLGDYSYYEYINVEGGVNCSYYKKYFNVCFSSSDIGYSLCFPYKNSCYWGCQGGANYCNGLLDGGLTNSQNLPSSTSFASVSTNWIGPSPGFNGYGDNSDNIMPGVSNTVCPTVGQLLSYYDSSLYNTGICYSPSIIYSGGSFQTITPLSIFELFEDLNDYKNYLQLYGTYCNSVSNLCEQAFSGKELQYLYIANLNQSLRSSEKQVYQYCNLSLNYDPNTSTCVGSGVLQGGDQVSNDDVLQGIVNGSHQTVLPVTGLVNGDTTVFNQFNFSSEYTGDIIDTINQLFVKFTSLFSQQTGNRSPLLPSYILVSLLGIILFKLFKK